MADSEEGFLSAWCMQTAITIPCKKCLLYAVFRLCAANLRHLQVHHQERNLGM